uniref:Uncharacterized protein n=1 Tax=Opuntia streptacantha TaxID=393608 RepID=A0A7C9AH54_OPUST
MKDLHLGFPNQGVCNLLPVLVQCFIVHHHRPGHWGVLHEVHFSFALMHCRLHLDDLINPVLQVNETFWTQTSISAAKFYRLWDHISCLSAFEVPNANHSCLKRVYLS